MENKSFVPDNIPPADLKKSWHIPRPTLARDSPKSPESSSTNSSHSARSGSLLLTAANLAQVQKAELTKEAGNSTRDQNIQYYLDQFPQNENFPGLVPKKQDPDSASLASSTHFTVVNIHTRPPKPRSFCRKHQLTVLVVTMSTLFTIGIMAAIWFLEKRAQQRRLQWS
ncbi:uncharacterized protein LOC123679289 isoform X1 [Harmonia axyridis]|uniref:uncharacterized protein LOC123679289 isoform X1 n=1 Tax=Harmonia axyridis TaxID=115357 RepID=UPI001E277FF8|nr:uncharacterized protein LOC123679289 isoform X1 [Harmonia axyridis]